jgi:hypothetical protein
MLELLGPEAEMVTVDVTHDTSEPLCDWLCLISSPLFQCFRSPVFAEGLTTFALGSVEQLQQEQQQHFMPHITVAMRGVSDAVVVCGSVCRAVSAGDLTKHNAGWVAELLSPCARQRCAAAGFGLPDGPLLMPCLRKAAKERHKDLAAFFPAECIAQVDADQV